MVIHAGVWSGLWIVFFVMFCIGPLVRWSVRAGRWGWDAGWDWEGRRPGRKRARWDRDGELLSLLEQRTAELDQIQSRVSELENRLDFAERLLAQQRNPQPLVSRAASEEVLVALPPAH